MVKPKNGTDHDEGWEQVVPSKIDYFERFKELDDLDLHIIFEMAKGPDSPRNVRKISKELELPQQTVNYRVQRFDKEGLVRFRAVINEALLGLASYLVIVTVKPGLVYVKSKPEKHETIDAETFLTCYPVWRMAEEVHGGSTHGFCVIYSIPPDKEDDLRLFLEELKRIGCISRVDAFYRVTPSHFNIPSLSVLLLIRKTISQKQPIMFNWENWVNEFDKAKEAFFMEETPRNKKPLSYEDLLVLFYLERNLREKFVDIAKVAGEPSGKIARRYKEILQRQLIAGCRVEICPVDPTTSLHLTLKVDLKDESALRKLAGNMNEIPYPVTYQKVIGEETIFVHMIVPPNEYVDFHNTFEALNRRHDVICNVDQYVSTFYSKFDNTALYDASLRDNGSVRWLFSNDVMLQALHRLIDDTRFRF